MTPTAEQILSFLSDQSLERPKWKLPFTTSISTHILVLLLLPLFLSFKPRMNIPGTQALEIHLIGSVSGSASMGEAAAPPAAASPGRSHLTAAGIARKTGKSRSRAHGMAALAPQGPLFGKGSSNAGSAGSDDEIVQTEESSALSVLRKSRGSSMGGSSGGSGTPGINLAARGPQGRRDAGTDEFASGDGAGDGDSSGDWRGQSIISGGSSDSTSEQTGSGKNGSGSAGISAPSRSFFSLTGPISSRKILHIRLPKYPLWAEQAGIQALISVRLTVSPDGHVRPDLVVEKTSGFPQLDQLALDAIRSMQFAALNADSFPVEEDGVATFDFRLKSPDVPPLDE